MQPIKIFHLIDSLGSGGKERQLIELIKGLSSHGEIVCEIILLSPNIYYSIQNFDIKINQLIRKNKKDLRVFLSLFFLCKKFRPNIIHTWDSMTSVYALPISKLLRVKLVNGMVRDAPEKISIFSKAWFRSKLTFKLSDVIVSNSKAGLISYNAPKSKSLYIHNGFDFFRIKKVVDRELVKKRLKLETSLVIGMVGSFSDRKDHRTFIKAAQLILDKYDDVCFLAIGAGKNLCSIKNMVKSKHRNKIIFLGGQKNVESIINIFDIGVLTTYTEGISNSIMEYMALGKPVIATKCYGTNEIVINQRTGILVEAENEIDLYNAMKLLLNNKKLRKEMGEEGKARIQQFFSLKKMTGSYVKLYQKLLSIS